MRHAARQPRSWLIFDVRQEMIHHTDENVFRVLELTCYWALFLGFPFVKIVGRERFEYFLPGTFTLLGAAALAYFTRYFIYSEPHLIWRRERATKIVLTRKTKIALALGYAMASPMLVLGCIGLFRPAYLERTIRTISPMRYLLE